MAIMRCDELQGLLDLFIDGDLTEEMRARIDRHLLRSPACSYAARSLEQTRSMLRDAVEPANPSPAYRERTLAKLMDALSDHLQTDTWKDARQTTLPFPLDR
jgi:anti-sigma factor RsiW